MCTSFYSPLLRYLKRHRFEWLTSCCGIFKDYGPVIYHPEMYSAFSPVVNIARSEEAEEERHMSGIWKKNILMGGKCKLLEYSGVIIYDSSGNLVPNSKPPRLALPWK